MKLLLDTHIWLWSLAEPKRLSRRVEQELRDANNELWLSPVSTREALLLHVKRANPTAWQPAGLAGECYGPVRPGSARPL